MRCFSLTPFAAVTAPRSLHLAMENYEIVWLIYFFRNVCPIHPVVDEKLVGLGKARCIVVGVGAHERSSCRESFDKMYMLYQQLRSSEIPFATCSPLMSFSLPFLECRGPVQTLFRLPLTNVVLSEPVRLT